MEGDRKKYYGGITIMISNAHRDLTEEEFKAMAKSVKKYINRLEKSNRYDGTWLFNDLESLEDAAMKGAIPLNVYLSEYKRLTGGEKKDE